MTEKTLSNDEFADRGRKFVKNLHERIDGSEHPQKDQLQHHAKRAHFHLQQIAQLTAGTGDIAARDGDDKPDEPLPDNPGS